MKTGTIAILGAGSWGTAIAIHLAKHGNRVLLWGHQADHIEAMRAHACNTQYLPGIPLPKTLVPTSNLDDCQQASEIIIAVPSHAFHEVLSKLPKPPNGLAWLTKGIDPQNHRLLSQLVAEKWGASFSTAAISGPSFAKEVAQGLPTAILIAGQNQEYSKKLRDILHHNYLRVYLNEDIIGVQLCGAVKNVLAIACGISDGMQYGANAKAALITRGLAEMSRLGMALGGHQETFMGLAGVGDLVLTCTDNQSRNRRFGLQIGQGSNLEDAEKYIGQVVEGKHNASQVCFIATQNQVEMPICQEVNAVIQGKIQATQAAKNLLTRPPKDEKSIPSR